MATACDSPCDRVVALTLDTRDPKLETRVRKPQPRDAQGLFTGPDEVFPGSDYSTDEAAFIMAMERYKRERKRPFPTWREVLHVALSLGYRRVN